MYEDLDLADVHAVTIEVRGYADGHGDASEYNSREFYFGEPAMYIDPAPARQIFEQIASGC